MINHIRTLILNETTSDEFVPSEFVPMPASPAAKRVRAWLFYGLSQQEKDARMYQVMQVLHTPALEKFVLAPDPRVTYLPLTTCKVNPGSLVDVALRLHTTITAYEEEVLFKDVPQFRELWRSDKMLFDIAGILLALAYHTDAERQK
jgi:hypothetical protein